MLILQGTYKRCLDETRSKGERVHAKTKLESRILSSKVLEKTMIHVLYNESPGGRRKGQGQGARAREPSRARHRPGRMTNEENFMSLLIYIFFLFLRFVSFANTCADTRDIDSTQTRSRTDAGRYTDHGRLKTKDALSQCGGARSAHVHVAFAEVQRRAVGRRRAATRAEAARRGPEACARVGRARSPHRQGTYIDTRASRAAGVSPRAHRPLRRTEGHRASG